MKCVGISSTCTGLDVLLIVRYLRRNAEPACAGCRDALTALGADFRIERRAADRPFQPRWLRNLTARDNTGELVA